MNVAAGALTITADDGVGVDDVLETAVDTLDVYNFDSGSIEIYESDDVTVDQLVNTAGGGEGGFIDLYTDVGTITVVAGESASSGTIRSVGTARIDVSAYGADGSGSIILNNDSVTADEGTVELYAESDIIVTTDGGTEISADGNVVLMAQSIGVDSSGGLTTGGLDITGNGSDDSRLIVIGTESGTESIDIDVVAENFNLAQLELESGGTSANIEQGSGGATVDSVVITSLDSTTSEVTDIDTTNFDTKVSFAQTGACSSVVISTGTVLAGADVIIRADSDVTVGDATGNAIIASGGEGDTDIALIAGAGGEGAIIDGGGTIDMTNGGELMLSSADGVGATGTGSIETVGLGDVAADATASGGIFINNSSSGGILVTTVTATDVEVSEDSSSVTVNGFQATSGAVELVTIGNVNIDEISGENYEVNAGGAVLFTLTGADSVFTIDTDGSEANVETSSGGVTVNADNIDLNGTITAEGQIVQLRQYSDGRYINLGAEGSGVGTGELRLSDPEFDNIYAETVRVGSDLTTVDGYGYANAILFTDAISIDKTVDDGSGGVLSGNFNNLSLITESTVYDNASGSVAVSGLRIRAGASVTLGDDYNGNDVDTFSAEVLDAGYSVLFLNESSGFTVGTVDTLAGITTAGGEASDAFAPQFLSTGEVLLSTDGSITVNDDIYTGDVTNGPRSVGEFTTSGAITLTAQDGIYGDARMVTGNVVHDGSLGGNDVANSGSISLTIAGGEGGGAVHLSAEDALTTGSSDLINVAGTVDFATSGSIVITGATNVSNGSGGSTGNALDVQLGEASNDNPGFATNGSINVQTTGGEGNAGEIRITSDDDLRVGTLETASGSAQNVSATVRDDTATLIIAGDSDLEKDANGDIVTLLADNMIINYNIDANRVTLSTYDISGSIGIDLGGPDVPGAGGEGGTLGLSSGDLDHIYANFLVVGADTAGAIEVTSSVNPGGSDVMHLITSTTVKENGGSIVVDELAVEATGEVRLDSELNDFGIVAVDTDSDDVSVTDNNDLDVGTVDGVVGIDTDSGNVIINAGGTLDVLNTIYATNNGSAEIDIDAGGLVALQDGAIQTDGSVYIDVTGGAINAASGGDGTGEILADGNVTLTADGIGDAGGELEINSYLDGGDGNADLTVSNTSEGVEAANIKINTLTDLFASVDLTIASASSTADLDLTNGDHIDINSLDDFTLEIYSVDTRTNGADFAMTSTQVDGSVIVRTNTVQTAGDGDADGDVFIRSELDLIVGDETGNAIITQGGDVTLEAGDEASIEAAIVTNGGDVDIDAAYGMTNSVYGTITTTGGGEGGGGDVNITVYDEGDMILAGLIDTSGESDSGNLGDNGGDVDLYAYNGNITTTTSGDIVTRGGESTGNDGGSGGSISIAVGSYSGGGSGDITIDGDLLAHGGYGDYVSFGGEGGNISLYAYNGNITLNGSADTSGGESLYGGDAGDAGDVNITAGYYAYGGGDITVNGAVTANGNDGFNQDGDGGDVYIETYDGSITVGTDGSIEASGYDYGGNIILRTGKYGGYDGGNDITINGTLTSLGEDGDGGDINLYADGTVDVNVNASIETNAITTYAAVAIYAYGDIALDGQIDSSGIYGGVDIESGDGSVTISGPISTNGGDVEIDAETGVTTVALDESAGILGGTITTTASDSGNDSGDVDIYSYAGGVTLDADITTSGANGGEGGDAGNVDIIVGGTYTYIYEYEGPYDVYEYEYERVAGGGNIYVNGTVTAEGGTGGGQGGDVDLYTYAGSVTIGSEGAIDTSGGNFNNSTDFAGNGDAGDISLNAGFYGGYDGSGNNIVTNGTLTALGGSGFGNAGDGGTIDLYADGVEIESEDGSVTITAPISTNSGDVDIEAETGVTTAAGGEGGPGGSITTVSGVDGNDGGDVDIDVYDDGDIVIGGDINTSGAAGYTGGEGGNVNMDTYDGSITVDGSIDTSGADATGSEGSGGVAGDVNIYSHDSDDDGSSSITLNNTITAAASSSGSSGGVAGAGGDVDVYAHGGSIEVNANIRVDDGSVHLEARGLDLDDIDGEEVFADDSGTITVDGTIFADGGSVDMRAYGVYVDNEIDDDSVVHADNAGTITVNFDIHADGGSVNIEAYGVYVDDEIGDDANINVDGAGTITVNGAIDADGGSVNLEAYGLYVGDEIYQGATIYADNAGTITISETIYADNGSVTIRAYGVYADDIGESSGNEVKIYAAAAATIDVAAIDAVNGSVVIEAFGVYVDDGIEDNVTIEANGAGSIVVSDAIDVGGGSVDLLAYGVYVDDEIEDDANINVDGAGSITVNGAIDADGGSVDIYAYGLYVGDEIYQGATIYADNAGTITISETIYADGGSVDIYAYGVYVDNIGESSGDEVKIYADYAATIDVAAIDAVNGSVDIEAIGVYVDEDIYDNVTVEANGMAAININGVIEAADVELYAYGVYVDEEIDEDFTLLGAGAATISVNADILSSGDVHIQAMGGVYVDDGIDDDAYINVDGAGSITVDAEIHAGGRVDLEAYGIYVDDDINDEAYIHGDNAGSITVNAGIYADDRVDLYAAGIYIDGSLSFDDDYVLIAAGAGVITVDAPIEAGRNSGRAIDLYAFDSVTTGALGSLTADGDYGDVYIDAIYGTVALNAAVRTYGGDVDIEAYSGVTTVAAATITTTGDSAGADSGDVDIDVYDTGDITIGADIDTSGAVGAEGGDGGNVTIDSSEDFALNVEIDSSGGDATGGEGGLAEGGAGGEGGIFGYTGVSVFGDVVTSGGSAGAASGSATGGAGGVIVVSNAPSIAPGEGGVGADGATTLIEYGGSLTSLGGGAVGDNEVNDGSGGGIYVIGTGSGDDAAVIINGTIESDGADPENSDYSTVGIYGIFGDVEIGAEGAIIGGGEGTSVYVGAGLAEVGHDVIMDRDATITAQEGTIAIGASGNVVLGQLTVGSTEGPYTSNEILVGAEGSISSADSGEITNISTDDGGYVELDAGSGIGSDDAGDENLITLSADGGDGTLELDAETFTGDINVSVDGSLEISNYSVEITNFSSPNASSDDNITLSASGDISLGSVDNNGSGNVTLTAGGSIVATGGEGGNIEANGDVSLSGIGIGAEGSALNVSGGEGSAMNLTASGGEGGEINVSGTGSDFDSLTITLEDADTDVYVNFGVSDNVVMSADGVDITLDDMRTTDSNIDVTIDSQDSDADVILAQGTAILGGDLDISSAGDVVLGDGSGGVAINVDTFGVAISLTADSDGFEGGAIGSEGGVIDFGTTGGSLEMNASDGIGADGAAVQITGGEGPAGIDIAAATDSGDVVIDSSGGAELAVTTVGGEGGTAGISTGDGDVTLAADNLDIQEVSSSGATVSGGRVILTTSSSERGIALGGGDSASLSLSEDELALVSADELQIGDTDNSGGINVSAAVSFTDAGHDAVHLQTGSGSIGGGEGGRVEVSGLAITSGGTVDLDGDNLVGTLAVDHTGAEGSVTFNDATGLEIGSVDGVDGVSAYDVTLSAGGAITDDGENIITATYLTINEASSVGNIEAGLSFDADDVDVSATGNIVLEAVGAEGVTISASVGGEGGGGIAIYSATEDVFLYDVDTQDGDILVGVDNNLYAYDVAAGGEGAADGDVILIALGDIDVYDVSAGSDLIAIAADGDIDFVNGSEGGIGGGNSTLTLAAGGDITFENHFGSEEDPIGLLNVTSATDFTINSPFDVVTIDVGVFNASGTVDLGDTLVVLGEGSVSISAGEIFGELSALDAASVAILAGGVIGEVNLEEEIDNPFVANTTATLSFVGAGGVIEGEFGAGDVLGFGWLGELDGTTFLINGVTVVFEDIVDVEEIVDTIIFDTNVPDSEVDLSGPSALSSTSTFVADVFSVDFSLGTNLSVAPAAGGDGEDGDTVGGPDDGGGDFLGNFWGDLIETAPEEDAEADADTEDAASDEFFGDDDDVFDDEDDIFGDDEEEDDLVFDDE